tara:strand:- start:733 stop:939 length:207 start_codon:yes stop_codon:yes gene_type:complete
MVANAFNTTAPSNLDTLTNDFQMSSLRIAYDMDLSGQTSAIPGIGQAATFDTSVEAKNDAVFNIPGVA